MTGGMARAADGVSMPDECYEAYKRLVFTEPERFCRNIRLLNGHRRVFLHLYLKLAADACEQYEKAGIHEKIYWDTMGDIVVWADNCLREYGEYGVEEGEWLWRHVTMKLFRLGRLQYETVTPARNIILNQRAVKAGQRVLNLHIPQGSPLLFAQCMDSLREAGSFFQGYGEITCHSWLLNPVLKQLLGVNSNIVRFQSLFEIYGLDTESQQAEERVFGRVEDCPDRYPEHTTLQKALKRYLLEGGRVGSAYGAVIYPNEWGQNNRNTAGVRDINR